MNTTNESQLFLSLFADIRPEDGFFARKPLLAHYTSINVLEKMLRDNEIWFSNPLFMNDFEEVRFVINEASILVRDSTEITSACGSLERAKLFRNSFQFYVDRFADQHLIDTYVFCLSLHETNDKDGLLSMWRGYGGNGSGVAIVFDSGKFEHRPESPIIIAEVTYSSSNERVEWIKGLLNRVAAIISTGSIPDNKLHVAAHYLFERLKIYSLFTKHHGFKEEKEWRVVYLKERDDQNRLASMYHYFIGPRGVEPKLKLKISPIEGLTTVDLSLDKIVDRIILGPSISNPLATASILKMLESLNKKELKERVCGSTIPFRAVPS